MTDKAKECIQPYVRSLLKCVAQVEPGGDTFSQLEQYIYSNIWSDKFNAVDRYSVKKSFDGVIRKFFIHGLSTEAEKMQNLLDKYLSSKDWGNDQQPDVRWHVLSLLLHLSYHPTGSTLADSPRVLQPVTVDKDDFDWAAYLMENQPDFISLGSDGSETEDECLSFDDELLVECLTEDATSESKPGAKAGKGEPVSDKSGACQDMVCTSYVEGTLLSARMWLEANILLPFVEECGVASKYASANLAKFCEGAVSEQPGAMGVSEHCVLREALRALQAPPEPSSWTAHGLFSVDRRGWCYPKGTCVVSSLTKGSLQSYLCWFGRHVSMVMEIECFIAEVSDALQQNLSLRDNVAVDMPHGGGKGSCCLPPLTHEAYASALKEYLLSFKDKVLAVEEKVKCQGTACTLLSVAQELRLTFKELEFVHRVHLDAVCCWKGTSNWLSSCRLLTVLYGALLSTFSELGASLCFHLFMKAFEPYLEIIHIWLTEGHLEDWRQEFIICKNELMCGNTENMWKEGFILRPYEEELLKAGSTRRPMGLLHLIRDKVLPLGKNTELLQRLDHLSEVQRSLPSFKRSLHGELIHILTAEMKDEPMCVEANGAAANHSSMEDCRRDMFLKPLVLGIEGSRDYYLKMAFRDVTQSEGRDLDSSWKLPLGQGCMGKKVVVGRGWSPCVGPLRVGCWLGRLLQQRHGTSGAIVRTLMLGEFSLASHLVVVRRVFLMEEGDCMQHFCTHLFEQVEGGGEKWVDALSLTNQLHECLSARWPDAVGLFSVRASLGADDEPLPPSVHAEGPKSLLDQLSHIHIDYAVQWPVNIVLNSGSVECYNSVFQFLLKVKWALWSLQQLRFCDLDPGGGSPVEQCANGAMPTSAKVHRLQLLRAWLLHFVGSVHAYLVGQVLHVLSVKVDAELEAASDLDAIIQVHENYLESICQQCLLTKSSEIIKMAITQVLNISLALCTLWKQPAIITPAQLYDMESQYIRHHVFLARVLENAMNRGFVDHLKALVSALVHSFPSH